MKAFMHGLFAFLLALIVAGGLSACSSAPDSSAEGSGEAEHAESAAESAGEHAENAEARESGEREGGEHAEGGEAREGGEHEGEEGESHDEGGEGEEGESHDEGGEGEESGVYIARADTWDVVRRGARLVLAYNEASNAFVGTVENTTESTMCAVRVEVHLSSGTELGPTTRTDVPAGQSIEVELPAGSDAFDSWTAHPELSSCSGS